MGSEEKSLDAKANKSSNLKFYQRRYVINSKLQVGVLLYSVSVAAVVSIVNQLFRYMQSEEASPILGMNPGIVLWIFNCLIVFAVVLFGFYFTNRIAGPIYRLQKHIEKSVAGGEVSPFTIRKGDYFQELMVAYNKFLEKMKDQKTR